MTTPDPKGAPLEMTPDQLLTTTRSVRRRLDLERPVQRALVEACLDLALQAPNGSNLQRWQWLVVDDRAAIGKAEGLVTRDCFTCSLFNAARGEQHLVRP